MGMARRGDLGGVRRSFDLDAGRLYFLQEYADLVGIQLAREVLDHLVQSDEPAFLTKGHEITYDFLFLLYQQDVGLLSTLRARQPASSGER